MIIIDTVTDEGGITIRLKLQTIETYDSIFSLDLDGLAMFHGWIREAYPHAVFDLSFEPSNPCQCVVCVMIDWY